jgi:hypothetical protein
MKRKTVTLFSGLIFVRFGVKNHNMVLRIFFEGQEPVSFYKLTIFILLTHQ